MTNLIHKELTEKIIGAFYQVYNELGYGFLEKVYEQALMLQLNEDHLSAFNPLNPHNPRLKRMIKERRC